MACYSTWSSANCFFRSALFLTFTRVFVGSCSSFIFTYVYNSLQSIRQSLTDGLWSSFWCFAFAHSNYASSQRTPPAAQEPGFLRGLRLTVGVLGTPAQPRKTTPVYFPDCFFQCTFSSAVRMSSHSPPPHL